MKETRVYVLKPEARKNIHGEGVLSDEAFMLHAENAGTVYTVDTFTNAFNAGKIDSEVDIIRILEVETPARTIPYTVGYTKTYHQVLMTQVEVPEDIPEDKVEKWILANKKELFEGELLKTPLKFENDDLIFFKS